MLILVCLARESEADGVKEKENTDNHEHQNIFVLGITCCTALENLENIYKASVPTQRDSTLLPFCTRYLSLSIPIAGATPLNVG